MSLGGSAGASIAIVDVGGSTKAYIDDAHIGQGTARVSNVHVLAESVADIDLYCLGVAGGILFGASGVVALGDYGPTIVASIRNDANITVANDVIIESHSRADVDTDALGVNVGGLAALGASITISTNEPTITTSIANAAVTARDGSILLRSIHNYDALGTTRLDQGAKAKAETGSGSLVLGAAGAYAEAEASATAFTGIAAGATVSAGTDIKLAPDDAVQTLANHGASKIYRSADAVYKDYLILPAAETVAGLIQQHTPAVMLFASSYAGRDLVANLSARLDCGAITDVGDFELKDGSVVATIPALGASYQNTSTLVNQGTKLLVVRPKSFEPKENPQALALEEVPVAAGDGLRKVHMKERVVVKREAPSLEGAKIVVSGGRGLKGEEQ